MTALFARPYPYHAYKPSGVEWLGDVPAHWDVRRIKSLFREVNLRKGDKEYVLLSLTRRHGLVPHDEVTDKLASAVDHTNYKVCHEGNLVMNRMQAWSGMFAVPTLVGIVSPDYAIYEPTVACELSYFEQLFKTRLMVNQFAQHSKGIGSGFNRLYTEVFGSIPTLAPPLPEQRAIARYLDYMDRRIQRYIEAKERLIELLGEQKRAVINQAVTRGLDPDVRLKPSGVEWLGDVPAHWEVRRLKSMADDVVDLTSDDSDVDLRIALENVESWTGVVHPDINDGVYESQMKRFARGDVLFGKLRPYLAKAARVDRDGLCVGEFLVIRAQDCNLNSNYLELVLRSKSVIDVIDAGTYGAKMPRANWDQIGGLHFPCPPILEQISIGKYVYKFAKRVDARIAQATRQIELMKEYRTRLTADVVTGKLDVREAAADLPDEMDEDELSDRLELSEVR